MPSSVPVLRQGTVTAVFPGLAGGATTISVNFSANSEITTVRCLGHMADPQTGDAVWVADMGSGRYLAIGNVVNEKTSAFNPDVRCGASTLGIATQSGRYVVSAGFVHWEVEWTVSGAVTAGNWSFLLPVNPASAGGASTVGAPLGIAIFRQGANRYTMTVQQNTAALGQAIINKSATGSVYASATNALPFTWAVNDAGMANGSYRIA